MAFNKFRSLTPSSRARRRAEEDAAANDQAAPAPQVKEGRYNTYRPSSSHSNRNPPGSSSSQAYGLPTSSHSNRAPSASSKHRRGSSSSQRIEDPDDGHVAVAPPVTDRRRNNQGLMSPTSQKSVAFFDEVDSDSSSTPGGSQAPRSSTNGSNESYETDATSVHTLPALQSKGHGYEHSILEPVLEDDPGSYDLVPPPQSRERDVPQYSLETRAEQITSKDHLQAIFEDPKQLRRFTSFLGAQRPQSVPLLIYYLDALKALAAMKYSNAVAEALEPLEAHDFTHNAAATTANATLEAKARQAFEMLTREDLPAFVTYTWVGVVSSSIKRRIMGTLTPDLRAQSEGLAEVFCLTDPSRQDNPIVFSSEEFHRTTQYGVSYVIGRNCRFLQGPRTNRDSVRRLREATRAGKDVCETFVNYRRDGSPFMNLLMTAPLRDSRGNLRYYIGAQVDVSNLVKECTDLESAKRMIAQKNDPNYRKEEKDEFQSLTEMFNQAELEIVRKSGGAMHRQHVDEEDETSGQNWHRPRLMLNDSSDENIKATASTQEQPRGGPSRVHGKLIGVYQNYLLVRPYPSLRILFASPALRVPGMLQSPFMNRIGSSDRVRDELTSAFAEGRGVTAKVKWTSKHEDEGRTRWIHCTPLYGSSGQIGVWMVVLVDDDSNTKSHRRFREAPPVASKIGSGGMRSTSQAPQERGSSSLSIEERQPHGRTATMGHRDEFDFRF